jgi:hypothetical protein
MPYLRLYSREVPIEQKHVLAQKLIEITLRTFHLRAEDRDRITIQFIAITPESNIEEFGAALSCGADFTLQVMSHELTENAKSAFSAETSVLLGALAPVKPKSRIARLLRSNVGRSAQIVLQFKELNPAISDRFVLEAERRAA